MKKKTRMLILLLVLVVLVVGGAWLLSTYARTKQAVADATEILHAAVCDDPEMTGQEAESLLVALSVAGVIDIRITPDSAPGDHFGNPLHIEIRSDSIGIMVYVMSPGVDGLPGTLDDVGHSITSSNYSIYSDHTGTSREDPSDTLTDSLPAP